MLVGRWTALALVASSILSLSLRTFAQTPAKVEPTEVEVCELVANPLAYDKQLVRFRGRLEFEFEGDTVDDHDCGMKPLHPGIWWTYSGDASLAHSHQAKEIEPLVSLTLRDGSFQTFEEHAHLRRALLPDRQPCRFRAGASFSPENLPHAEN